MQSSLASLAKFDSSEYSFSSPEAFLRQLQPVVFAICEDRAALRVTGGDDLGEKLTKEIKRVKDSTLCAGAYVSAKKIDGFWHENNMEMIPAYRRLENDEQDKVSNTVKWVLNIQEILEVILRKKVFTKAFEQFESGRDDYRRIYQAVNETFNCACDKNDSKLISLLIKTSHAVTAFSQRPKDKSNQKRLLNVIHEADKRKLSLLVESLVCLYAGRLLGFFFGKNDVKHSSSSFFARASKKAAALCEKAEFLSEKKERVDVLATALRAVS